MQRWYKEYQAEVVRNIRRNVKYAIKELKGKKGWKKSESPIMYSFDQRELVILRQFLQSSDKDIFKIHLATKMSYQADLSGTTKRVVNFTRYRTTLRLAKKNHTRLQKQSVWKTINGEVSGGFKPGEMIIHTAFKK